MKILIVGQNNLTGGVQTSMINMLKELSTKKELQISLYLFNKSDSLNYIPPNIAVYYGNAILELVATPLEVVLQKRNFIHIMARLFCMVFVRIIGSRRFYDLLFQCSKRAIGEFDIAISYFHDVPRNYFNQGTNQFVGDYVKAKRKFAWIHTDPVRAKFDYNYCRELYKEYHKVVSVSEACKEKFDEFIPEYKSKSMVVHNLFPASEIRTMASEYIPFQKEPKVINIVTVGRVDNCTKRMDRIVKVCGMLKADGIINFVWRVVGSGPDRTRNVQLSQDLGVTELVEFVGNKVNPFPYIKNSDLFVLTSAFEGYPMVVEEAMILGVPVIATNYAAAKEQIKNYGIIVEMSTKEIYRAIKRVLLNRAEINTMKVKLQSAYITNEIALKELMNLIKFD